MSPAGGGTPPLPRVAYQQWLDTLTRAGWSPRPGEDSGQRMPGGGGAERVAVGNALGRITAGPVTARWPSPRAACAAMDGIAVLAADLIGGPGIPAGGHGADGLGHGPDGECTVRLPPGRFRWIDTGDPMPDGADTVVLRERLLPQADGGVLVSPASGGPAGRHVRPAGEDFRAGEVLVPAGRRLRPGDLAAAAAGGHAGIAVLRRPAVAIIPTGDEIRPVGSVLHRGEITDSNSVMLAARCRELAALPSVSDVVPDDPDALAARVRRAADGADLVLVIAGSSRGRGDHAAAVLAQVGGVAVAGVAVRPGHPALLGHAKRPAARDGEPAASGAGITPVIGLPGYPLAAAVVFELFGAPMLAALGGHEPAQVRARARLDRDWDSPAAIDEWVLVTLCPGGSVPVATPARRGAGSISQLARADAWWPVPAGQGAVARGTEIEVIPVHRS